MMTNKPKWMKLKGTQRAKWTKRHAEKKATERERRGVVGYTRKRNRFRALRETTPK